MYKTSQMCPHYSKSAPEVRAMTPPCDELEAERDRLREELDKALAQLDAIEEYGTQEINEAVDLRHELAEVLGERDEAREERDRLRGELSAAEKMIVGLRVYLERSKTPPPADSGE